MAGKWRSIGSMAAAALAWLRGGGGVPADGRKRNVLPTTAMASPNEPGAAALRQLHWHRAYESGHPVIDQQHSALFEVANTLIQAVQGRQPKAAIELLLYEFIDHIREHFATEEDVMARTRFPLSHEHMEIHRDLLERAHELRQRYVAGEIAAGDLVGFIAYEVIADHILSEDMKFALRGIGG